MLQKSWNSVCRIGVCASSTAPQFLLDQYQVGWAARMHSSKPEIQRDSKRFCQDSVSACLSLFTSLQSLQDLQMRQVTVCNGGFMLGRVSSRAADNLSSTSGSVLQALEKSWGSLGEGSAQHLMFGAESAQMFGLTTCNSTQAKSVEVSQFIAFYNCFLTFYNTNNAQTSCAGCMRDVWKAPAVFRTLASRSSTASGKESDTAKQKIRPTI